MRAILCGCLFLAASGAPAAEIAKTHIDVNTVGTVSLSIVFDFSEPIAREKTADVEQPQSWSLEDGEGLVLWADEEVGFSRNSLRFVVGRATPKVFEALYDPQRQVHVMLKHPLRVVFESGSEFLLTPEVCDALSRQMGAITARQKELVEKHRLGTYLLSKDVLDFARELDASDTTRSEYVGSYRFVRPIFRGAPVLWRAEGRLGTQSEEPLNYVEFAATSQSPIVQGSVVSARGFIEASYQGDQRLQRTTLNGSLGIEAIVPNLIDLTGTSGRVRPKPALTIGASYARRPDKQVSFGDKTTSWEWFASIEYYVPVATKLALSYAGRVRYSDNLEASRKVRSLSTASLSYDLPLEDLKALIKWETGQHALVTEQGQRLLAGVLLDRLPF